MRIIFLKYKIGVKTKSLVSMKISFFCIIFILPYLANCQTKVDTSQAKTKTLVWSDEFNYKGLPDSTKWGFEKGFVRNKEPQYYTKGRLENARVAGGNLIITVIKEDYNGGKYTSASINTKGKYDFTYGRIEVRAKLPIGRGVWPAIWMLGQNRDQVGWPACGEIDIMEYVGHEPNTIQANVHTLDYNHTKGTGRKGRLTFEKPYEDFHIYAVEWYPDRMDFYFDNNMFFSCKNKGEGIGEWPFTAPQYLILNLALKNKWPAGQPGLDDSVFPQEFLVDYVRVYEIK